MANSIWKGHIALGLVAIPVKLHAAARSQAVSFNQLHQCDHSRVIPPFLPPAPVCLAPLALAMSAGAAHAASTSCSRKFHNHVFQCTDDRVGLH